MAYQDPMSEPWQNIPGGHGGVTGGMPGTYTSSGAQSYSGQLPPGYSQAEVDDWLARNPGDAGRMMSALNDKGGGGGGGGQSMGGGGFGGWPGAVSPWTQDMRKILLEQLGAAGKAPTVNDPGIRENLAGQRLALQRSAERQRGATAESLAGGGLASSGAADTTRLGIEQARGEAEQQGVGQVLGAELQQRRQQLMGLLGMAMQSGDAESARQIQMALADMQNSQFNDQMGFNWTQLNQQGNLQALLAMLNSL